MVDFKINETHKIFSPKLPQKISNKKSTITANRNSSISKKKSSLPIPLRYLTDEMVAIVMDYYTLRYLAYKSMGLTLNCSSNYKVFRVDRSFLEWEESEDSPLTLFEKKWRRLTRYSAVFWPEAISHMNSISLAYVDSEYDGNFKHLRTMGPRTIEKLMRYMLSILRKL